MESIFILAWLLFLLAVVTSFVCPSDWETKVYHVYPVSNQPDYFYNCGHQGAVLEQCPENHVFNSFLHYCVVKEVSPTDTFECQSVCPTDWESKPFNAYKVPGTTREYFICGHQCPVYYECPLDQYFNDTLHQCVWL